MRSESSRGTSGIGEEVVLLVATHAATGNRFRSRITI